MMMMMIINIIAIVIISVQDKALLKLMFYVSLKNVKIHDFPTLTYNIRTVFPEKKDTEYSSN